MGTSVNQRSPANSSSWRAAQDAYVDIELSSQDSLKLIWRAASNMRESNLFDLIARMEVSPLMEVAVTSSGPAEAAGRVRSMLSESKSSTLATDIAARAVCQAAGKQNASQVFVERLFVEATSYLVSRDVPGYVGASEKLQTISDAKNFSNELTRIAVDAVRSISFPESTSQSTWSDFVRTVVAGLEETK